MNIQPITIKEKAEYNTLVTHPLQSYEWGEFREKAGVKVIRRGIFEKDPSASSGLKLVSGFQLTIHKIPHTPFTIGYLPKGELPNKTLLEELTKIGREERCIFIQLEPNIIANRHSGEEQKRRLQNPDSGQARMTQLGLRPAAHPLFTKYTFVLDLTKSEDDLLKDMHSKTRYNIKIARKHNVEVKEDNSQKAFDAYQKLIEETTKRQKFYAHTRRYHKLQWQTVTHDEETDHLTSHLFTATYEGKILTTLLFFVFKDTLYYPYGASSNEHRNVMHSNLAMWEAIRFGKKLGLKKFDMWGAMGSDPDKNDPWYGFHNFKERYGPDHVEFMGSYDLIINPLLYQGYKVADKLRWMLLKMKK